jgi:flagellar hook assembly protein FlgD
MARLRRGMLAVLIVGAAVGSTGTTASSAYAASSPLQITAVSPNPFSPNHDGRADTTAFHLHLPNTEHVSFAILNVNGQTIQGPHTPGTLAAGAHTFHWDGKNNSGKVAGNGVYTILVTTTTNRAGTTVVATTAATVRVDNSAPVLSALTGNASTFFPRDATYRNAFRPSVHVSQGGSLWLEIFTVSGTEVNVVAQPHAGPGTFHVTWNGRNRAGALAAAGTYRFHFTAQNVASTRGSSPTGVVHLSHLRAVNKKVTFSKEGADFNILHSSDAACARYSYKHSTFKRGVLLENACSRSIVGVRVVYADFAFTIPSAVSYASIKVLSYGATLKHAPESVLAHIYSYSTRKWESAGEARVSGNRNKHWSAYGTVHTGGRVSGHDVVKVRITVPDFRVPAGEDYDLGTVAITVALTELQ